MPSDVSCPLVSPLFFISTYLLFMKVDMSLRVYSTHHLSQVKFMKIVWFLRDAFLFIFGFLDRFWIPDVVGRVPLLMCAQ